MARPDCRSSPLSTRRRYRQPNGFTQRTGLPHLRRCASDVTSVGDRGCIERGIGARVATGDVTVAAAKDVARKIADITKVSTNLHKLIVGKKTRIG